MKVEFFSSGLAYKLGGPSFSEALLIKELRKLVDVNVYVPKEHREYDFIEDYEIENVVAYKPNELPTLLDKIKTTDLIHLNGHWKWWYSTVSKFALQRNIPYLLHPRGMLLVGHRKIPMKKVFNFAIGNSIVENAAMIIALSEYEKKQFLPYRIPPEKVTVIPNPIEVVPTLKAEKPQLPKGVADYFVYLGRIERRKNLVFLVQSYKLYKSIGGKNSLLIIGPVERGYDLEIREAIHSNGLEQNVLILPPAYQELRDRFLQHAKALVYPATDEPFGRVPFEALVVKTPPIVPHLSGASEYLNPFLPDCIYRDNNAMDLAKTLMKVDAIDPDRLDDASNWVAKNLSPIEITKRVLKLYQEVLQRSVASTIYGDLSSRSLTKSATHQS